MGWLLRQCPNSCKIQAVIVRCPMNLSRILIFLIKCKDLRILARCIGNRISGARVKFFRVSLWTNKKNSIINKKNRTYTKTIIKINIKINIRINIKINTRINIRIKISSRITIKILFKKINIISKKKFNKTLSSLTNQSLLTINTTSPRPSPMINNLSNITTPVNKITTTKITK